MALIVCYLLNVLMDLLMQMQNSLILINRPIYIQGGLPVYQEVQELSPDSVYTFA